MKTQLNMKKKVYVGMSADLIHPGHLNVIKEAAKHGEVIVGLLTDKAIVSYKRLPYLDFEQRKIIIESLKDVSKVIAQDSLDYKENLEMIKPDYVVHGDDWKEGIQHNTRMSVINLLKQWGGQLIEVPYTEGISTSKIINILSELGTTPDIRRNRLRRLINSKNIVRIIEAHSGLSGLIVEKTKVEVDGNINEFDGMWASSLTDSTTKGKPDIEAVDVTSRLFGINDLLEVTTKPIIFDGDTGGKIEHFVFTVKTLERLGVSAIIIEDKIGLKKNSLFGTDVDQEQDTIEGFCEKIVAGRKAKVTDEFMIIARIESLILNKGIDDAISRAKAYTNAGVDAIMIHSKNSSPDEIFEFCKIYNSLKKIVPIVVVPSSFDSVYEDELIRAGVKIVIYANQLLRSAYPAMLSTAKSILTYKRAFESRPKLMTINEILTLIPGGK